MFILNGLSVILDKMAVKRLFVLLYNIICTHRVDVLYTGLNERHIQYVDVVCR